MSSGTFPVERTRPLRLRPAGYDLTSGKSRTHYARAMDGASIFWLGAAVLSALIAFLVGWPAYRDYRQREERERNAARYLAWRGRAREARSRTPGALNSDERRRLWIAGALAVVAVVCLVAFFTLT